MITRVQKSLPRIDEAKTWLMSGDSLKIEVAVTLGGLTAEDVVLECIIGTNTEHDTFVEREYIRLRPAGTTRDGEAVFSIDLSPPLSGLQFYKLRLYPYHPLLSHPFETGHIIWL
jgi:starch phosphorylase